MADAPKFTPAPWHFDRMESAAEYAELTGKSLAEHDGYFRDNNGDWIVTWKDVDGEGGRIAGVSFKGKAKRGQAYGAPDPEGQANARLIAEAPELLAALAVSTAFLRLEAEGHRARGDKEKAEACESQAERNAGIIAKATGA